MPGHPCPRCGVTVRCGSGRGRPRVWCSTACRRAASIERQAAERDGAAVQPVVVPRPPTAREDAAATAALLHDLTTRLEHGEELPRPVRLAADALATAVMRTAEDPFGWRVVPPAVRRERAKARERMRTLRAQRAAQSPPPEPHPASHAPAAPASPPSPPAAEPRRVDLDAVELFIDTAAARIRSRQLDDNLAALYLRLTAATGRMVEAVQELRPPHTPPATPPPTTTPTMNRAQRRQAHREESRKG